MHTASHTTRRFIKRALKIIYHSHFNDSKEKESLERQKRKVLKGRRTLTNVSIGMVIFLNNQAALVYVFQQLMQRVVQRLNPLSHGVDVGDQS